MPFVQINYPIYFHLQKFMDDFSAENPWNIEINNRN